MPSGLGEPKGCNGRCVSICQRERGKRKRQAVLRWRGLLLMVKGFYCGFLCPQPTAHSPQREILPALSIERPASSPGAEVEQQVTSRGRPTVLCELQREASSGEIEKLLLHLRVSTISVCQTQKTLS